MVIPDNTPWHTPTPRVVEGEASDVYPHKHLGELQHGDELGHPARDVEAHGTSSIVGVHQRVDKEVHATEDAAHGVGVVHPVVGVGQNGHVMIPVEEGERALAEDDEGCVSQLQELGETEQVAPDSGARDHGHVAEADGVVHPVGEQRAKDGRKNGDGAYYAEDGQPYVPQYQLLFQVVGLSIGHPLPPLEHQRQVDARGVQTNGPGPVVECNYTFDVHVALYVLQRRQR